MSKAKKKTVKRARPVKTTALARRAQQPQRLEIKINDPEKLLPAPIEAVLGELNDVATVGNLGMVEVKLTDAEEAVLAEAVNKDDVLVKPNGVPYLSHPAYTKWFNRAFGRLGWALVPKAKPSKAGNLVVVPYVLYIHGQPAAFAMGEQDYHDNNRQQTYGDAIEATVASALRRCAKRLGVGLELWDKRWLNEWLNEYAEKKGSDWQLKRGGPGLDVRQEPEPPAKPAAKPQAGSDGSEEEKITLQQRDRLKTIAARANRIPADVTLWLKALGYKSSADILRKDYDAIADHLAVKGALPMKGDGQ